MARISFPFGIEKEAEIYCRASKVGLSTDANAPKVIKEMADNLAANGIKEFPKQEIFGAIAHWTRRAVEDLNDDSEDNVAWWIALYCSSVIKATMPDCSFDYDDIYKYAFKDYYSQYNY